MLPPNAQQNFGSHEQDCPFRLAPKDRETCQKVSEGRKYPAYRARVLLGADAGETDQNIATIFGISPQDVAFLKRQYGTKGLDGTLYKKAKEIYNAILSDRQREVCRQASKESGSYWKARRACILLKVDAGETDMSIAKKIGCSTEYVQKLKRRLKEDFDVALYGKPSNRTKKIYHVRLTPEQRDTCRKIKGLKNVLTTIKNRASILLKADIGWTDKNIAMAVECSLQLVEKVRKRCVTEDFDVALYGKQNSSGHRPKSLDDEQKAEIIDLWLSDPPEGRKAWSLRLLAEEVKKLGIPKVSHTTISKLLPKVKSQDE